MCREVSYEGRIEGSCPWESNACCDPEYVHLTSQMSRGLLDVIAHITNSGQLGPRLQLCTRSAAELAMKAERKRGGFGQEGRAQTYLSRLALSSSVRRTIGVRQNEGRKLLYITCIVSGGNRIRSLLCHLRKRNAIEKVRKTRNCLAGRSVSILAWKAQRPR